MQTYTHVRKHTVWEGVALTYPSGRVTSSFHYSLFLLVMKPRKLQVTFRKLFISWWKCNNWTCQLLDFWVRRRWNGAYLSRRTRELPVESNLSLSLRISLSICPSGFQWSSVLFTSFHLPVCHSLWGPRCPSACFQPVILVTAMSKHISCIKSRAGFSGTRLYHLAPWMQMENLSQGKHTPSSFPKTMTLKLFTHPTK